MIIIFSIIQHDDCRYYDTSGSLPRLPDTAVEVYGQMIDQSTRITGCAFLLEWLFLDAVSYSVS